MGKQTLTPISHHINFTAPKTRNALHLIVNEELGINSYNYGLYITSEREMLILLHPGIEKPKDITALKTKIEKVDKYLIDVDILGEEEYTPEFFEIKDSDDLHQTYIDMDTMQFSLASVRLVGRNELEKRILHIMVQMENDPKFDHSIVQKITPHSWSSTTSDPIFDRGIQHISIRETIKLFSSHIGDIKCKSDFTANLHKLLEFFESTMNSKQMHALRRVLFQSPSAPYPSYFVENIYYKNVHIKLYLLLYHTLIQYKKHSLVTSENIKKIKRKSSKIYLEYLDRIDAGETVNSLILNETIEEYGIDMVRYALNTESSKIAGVAYDVMVVLFESSDGAKRTYLKLMGFGKDS